MTNPFLHRLYVIGGNDYRDSSRKFKRAIPNTQTKIKREFVVTTGDTDEINFVDFM